MHKVEYSNGIGNEIYSRVRSVISRESIDRRNQTLAIHETIYYDQSGNVVEISKYETPIAITVVPDSVGEHVFLIIDACMLVREVKQDMKRREATNKMNWNNILPPARNPIGFKH